MEPPRGSRIKYLKKSVYEVLDGNEAELVENIRKFYQRCRLNAQLGNYLCDALQQHTDPYTLALKLAYCSGDFHSSGSKSLAFFIIMQLNTLLIQKKIPKLKDPQIKLDALRLITEQRNNAFRDLTITVFDMSSDGEIFIPVILEMIERKLYKDACQVANKLKLHKHFHPKQMLLPLCVQDKLGVVEDFLANDPNALKDFLAYMDELVANDTFEKINAIIGELAIPDVHVSRCGHKPLVKLMRRLLKTHGLPDELCPNMEKRRKQSAITYVIAKRFDSQECQGSESWSELVMDAVGDCPEMKRHLLKCLIDRAQPLEAIEWANRFQIPVEDWPLELQEFTNQTDLNETNWTTIDQTSNENVINFLRLPFDPSKIVLVDTEVQFSHFIEQISHVDTVGIDAEWKPNLIRQNELALIQVATNEQVFIIDRITLVNLIPEKMESDLLEKVFHNSHLVKLGFDFVSDLKELKAAFPNLKEINNLLDLASLRKILTNKYRFKFPHQCDAEDANGSLKNLVQLSLNKTLDKTEQCSNWERRPLRPSQINYAALDAYCLIEIFNVIRRESKLQNIPIEEVINDLLLNKSMLPYKTGKESQHSIRPFDAHFICTWELVLLSKRLRRCGIDAWYNDSRRISKLNMKNLRKGYTLLTTVAHNELNRDLKWHLVPCAEEKNQLQQVLNKFKIEVMPEDTVSRCTECNGNEMSELPGEEVRNLIEHSKRMANTVYDFLPEAEDPVDVDDDDAYYDDDEDGYDDDIIALPPAPSSIQVPNRWTSKGAVICFEKIPEQVLESVSTFFVCESCGHVTWPTTFQEMFLVDG